MTGSPVMGALVTESVSTPETVMASAKSLVAVLTMRLVGSVTVVGVVVEVEVSYTSPAKLVVIEVELAGWSTTAMVQLASPLASVVSLQDWAVDPEPTVNVTTLVGKGVPALGVSVVSVPLSVMDCR